MSIISTTPTTNSNTRAKDRLELFRADYAASVPKANFDYQLWQSVEIVSAQVDSSRTTGRALFALTVPQKYCNKTGFVHGGAIATLLDGLTSCSIAIVARKAFWEEAGVTRNLSISYLRPVVESSRVLVECEIIHAGERLATIRGTMKREGDGKPLAICLQEKFDPAPRARL